MNRDGFKTLILGSVVASVLLLSGCGSDGDTADTTAPEFTSQAALNVNESTQLNHTVVATDASGSITYSKNGGADEALFSINASTGVLAFAAPDVDADTDYTVTIKATDSSDNSKTQNITVTVKIIPDTTAPMFSSSNELNITENLPLTHSVIATDDSGSISYSKDTTTANGGLFEITPTGILTFNAPAVDADANYEIKVKATDSSNNSNTQNITVTVKEAGSITNRAIMPIDTADLFTRDATNNTVRNTLTGFIWEDTNDNDDNKTFAEAKIHCDNLTLAGIDNWRLPSRADLFKLVNYNSDVSNYMDDTFLNKASGVYWTAEEEGTKAWGVSYTGGTGDFRVDKTLESGISTAFVRCVSGEHQPPRFTGTHESQTRTDLDTALEWQTHVHSSITTNDGAYHHDMNWSTAKTTCENVGFRLPTINELRSIVEYNTGRVFGNLTINVEVEGEIIQESARSEANGLNGSVWSSTETSDGKVKTLYIVKTGGGATPATIKDEIYDTTLEKNATAFDIKGVCVK